MKQARIIAVDSRIAHIFPVLPESCFAAVIWKQIQIQMKNNLKEGDGSDPKCLSKF